MIIKIMINTPKGQAATNEKKIRHFILGHSRRIKIVNNYVNDDDSQFIWEIEGHVRDILRIQKNVSRFDVVMRMALDNKLIKKTVRKKLAEDQELELQDLLKNQTSVEM
jgi:hypothetical protein